MATGGLGGYFGFMLARGGNNVYFVSRGKHLETIKKHGLRLVTNEGDSTIQAKATDNPKDVGPVDLVLFCVKTYDTLEAAKAILPILEPRSTVLTLQNGVNNYETISSIVGKERVLLGGALVASEVKEPGVIKVSTKVRKVVIGELGGVETDRASKINQMFKKAEVDCDLTNDIEKFLWRKMLWICGMAGMNSITRLPIGDVLATKETKEMFRQVMEEVASVARAKGVEVGQDFVKGRVEFAERELEKDSTASMMRDLLYGKRLELDALNGAIVRMGKELNVPTPMNQAIDAALRPHLNGRPARVLIS